jgi:hypothetical protein
VFGIGGSSRIDIMVSKDKDLLENIYGEKDRDQYFRSRMGVVGVNHVLPINANTFVRTTLSASHSRSRAVHDYIRFGPDFEVLSLFPILGYTFRENRLSLTSSLTRKFGLQAHAEDRVFRGPVPLQLPRQRGPASRPTTGWNGSSTAGTTGTMPTWCSPTPSGSTSPPTP